MRVVSHEDLAGREQRRGEGSTARVATAVLAPALTPTAPEKSEPVSHALAFFQ